MEATTTTKPVPIHRWLPYWAVLQADVQQTLRSWVYRFWVLATLLAAIISLGVTISAMVNNTAVGIAALWIVLYGGGLALSLLPDSIPSPDRALLHKLPAILQGKYNAIALLQMMGWSVLFSCGVS